MNSPIEEIKKAVAENRTGDALSRLLELSQNNKQLHDAIHIVLAEFNDLTSQRLKGTIDNSEATRRLNVIHDKILVALGAFDSEGRVLPGSMMGKKTSAAGLLGRITVYLWGGAALLCLLYTIPYLILNGNIEGIGHDLSISIIPVLLGLVTFIGYVLALVVSASKK
ncbi:MAG: hypothetical protein KF734_02815 [Saprospiraceae bacterium]|nr:hypothetical protein [Saprospiraceae bacterium]